MATVSELRIIRISDGQVLLHRKDERDKMASGNYKDFVWHVHTHWMGDNHADNQPIVAPAQHWTLSVRDIEVRDSVPYCVKMHYFPLGEIRWEIDYGEGHPLEMREDPEHGEAH